MLLSHVPVGGLHGPPLTWCTRLRSSSLAPVAEPPAFIAGHPKVQVAKISAVACRATAQWVVLYEEAAAPIKARIDAAGLTGHWLAMSLRTFALAPGHTSWPRSKPELILGEELEKLRLKAFLFLAMFPSEVFRAETVWAIGSVDTCPSFVAWAVFAAMVFHFLGLQAVSPLPIFIKVGGGSTPGLGAWQPFADAFVVQLTVVLKGKMAEPPVHSENHSGPIRFVLELLGVFPWWSRKCQIQTHQQRPQEQQSHHGVCRWPRCLPRSEDQ